MWSIDYVCETKLCANLDANSSTGGGGLLGKLVKYNVTFLHLPFSSDQPTGQKLRPILSHDDSNHARMCLLGVAKIKGDI